MLRTLRDIHGVATPVELTVESWNQESGQRQPFTIPT
jgi:hypothetical protein